jgi:hypothetical protein
MLAASTTQPTLPASAFSAAHRQLTNALPLEPKSRAFDNGLPIA